MQWWHASLCSAADPVDEPFMHVASCIAGIHSGFTGCTEWHATWMVDQNRFHLWVWHREYYLIDYRSIITSLKWPVLPRANQAVNKHYPACPWAPHLPHSVGHSSWAPCHTKHCLSEERHVNVSALVALYCTCDVGGLFSARKRYLTSDGVAEFRSISPSLPASFYH